MTVLFVPRLLDSGKGSLLGQATKHTHLLRQRGREATKYRDSSCGRGEDVQSATGGSGRSVSFFTAIPAHPQTSASSCCVYLAVTDSHGQHLESTPYSHTMPMCVSSARTEPFRQRS